jgi:predicted metal-dependent hydrolase
MSTETVEIRVSGLAVQIVRKDIKNLHLGVYPPNGRVRVAAPLRVTNGAVRLAVIGKLGWIKRQQATFAAQPRQTEREMVSGESVYFLGRRYRLRVLACDGASKVLLRNKATIELHVSPRIDAPQRERVLQRWYRGHLKALIPPLLKKWEPRMGVQVVAWGIKRMKTKWGSCNPDAQRIWINLELAKQPVRCLEYIVVHEMAHLLERRHSDRFRALMDRKLPHWRSRREELRRMPLGHERWKY